MERHPRLSDMVTWTATEPAVWRLLLGRADDSLSYASMYSPMARAWSTESNPVFHHEPEALGRLHLWREPDGSRHLLTHPDTLTVYGDRLTLVRSHQSFDHGPRHGHAEEAFDVTEHRLLGARPIRASWARSRKDYDRGWVAEVHGPEGPFSMVGPWLILAYVGTLAGWQEPA